MFVRRAALCLSALVTLFVVVPLTAETDYSCLPEDPRKKSAACQAAKLDLAALVKAAQEQTKATATFAEAIFTGGKPTVEVHLLGNDKSYVLLMDPLTGAISDKKEEPMTAPTLPGDPVTGEPQTTASGLAFYDLKVGDGKVPAGPTSKVHVHYTGWLVDGKKFDSSVDRGQPISFSLNQVIRGWTEGVGSMKVGGRRKLIIPYQLGYGEQGRPPVIPSKAMLIFDVELLGVD